MHGQEPMNAFAIAMHHTASMRTPLGRVIFPPRSAFVATTMQPPPDAGVTTVTTTPFSPPMMPNRRFSNPHHKQCPDKAYMPNLPAADPQLYHFHGTQVPPSPSGGALNPHAAVSPPPSVVPAATLQHE